MLSRVSPEGGPEKAVMLGPAVLDNRNSYPPLFWLSDMACDKEPTTQMSLSAWALLLRVSKFLRLLPNDLLLFVDKLGKNTT